MKVSDSLDNVPNENVVTTGDRPVSDQLLELLEWLFATKKDNESCRHRLQEDLMQSDVLIVIFLLLLCLQGILVDGIDQFCSLWNNILIDQFSTRMSFTVLRVEVQQWEDEGISLPGG